MEGTGHFSRLVSQLNLDERAKLLEKLNSQSNLQKGPLYVETPDEPDQKIESRFDALPWYYRLWLRIVSFFNSRPPLKLFEDSLMSNISRTVEEKAPGFYNFQKDLLLPKFQDMLTFLRDGSRFFYSALDASLNRDRGGLMVFLGSLEMPEIHQRIQDGTDLPSLAKQFPNVTEPELKTKALRAMEDAMAGINTEQRALMYQNARSLNCLKQLSSFLFDRMINAFIYDSAHQGKICNAASIRDQLLVLNNILNSMREAPPMSLLESLFVFVLSEHEDEPGFDVTIEMRKLLAKAESSLEAIRDFNKQVPLTLLLRCMSRNMSISPQNIGGGEDWYTTYRDQWKSQIDQRFSIFIKTKRQLDLQNSFRYFLKGTNLKMLENMGSDANPQGVPVRGAFCLSFLQTFYTVVFMGEINKILRPVLIDGEFINKENRTEFTESYNNIIKLEDLIRRFDQELSPVGDYGKRYTQARSEMSSLPVKRRKTQIVLQEAASVASGIINQTTEALKEMIKVLGGIIKKSPDERYDTLSNLSAMGRTAVFLEAISACLEKFQKTLKLIEDIDNMEMR
jgi:hypothetical protein